MAVGLARLKDRDFTQALMSFRLAAKLDPKNPEPLYQTALVLITLGDLQGAVDNLMAVTQRAPKHTAAQLKLAELMAMSGNIEVVQEAERRARSAMVTAASTSEAITTLAMAELRLGKLGMAQAHLAQAVNEFPKDLKPAIMLAASKMQAGDSDGAERTLLDAALRSPKPAPAEFALAEFYLSVGKVSMAEEKLRKAVKLDPDYAQAWATLARLQSEAQRTNDAEASLVVLSKVKDRRYNWLLAPFLLDRGRTKEAIALLEHLAAADPRDRLARSRLIGALLAKKQNKRAEQLLSDALKENREDIDALIQRSQVYILSGVYRKAQNDLNQVLGYRPSSAEAHYLLARVHQSQGARLNQRGSLADALHYRPDLLVARLDLAQSLLDTNDANGALDLLRAAPEGQSDELAWIVKAAWAHLAQGDVKGAAAEVTRGMAANPAHAELHIQRAVIEMRAGRGVEARKALASALKYAPDDIRALELLARSFGDKEGTKAAIQVIREHAAQQPKSAPVQQFLGMLLAANGERDEARIALDNAKAADPTFVAADLASAQIDLTEGKYDAVRRRLAGVLAKNTGNLDARLLLGMTEEAAGNYEPAINRYREVVQAEPSNLVAMNNLAYRLASVNRTDEAMKFAQMAVEQTPQNLAFEDTLGWVLYQRGEYRAAITHLVRSTQERVPVRLYHLSMAYAKSGDKPRAREVLMAANRLNVQLPERAMAAELAK
jgi:putative PEP-CTERM system TPR-repeat lipoprotein